ncbi:MAG: hypothetical protein ABI396_02105 [Ktedonobacteraceae bacterium]
MFDFDYPKVRQSLGEAALRDQYPVWLLDPDGVFKATNLMALWLWGMLMPEEPITPHALLGTSAFALLAAMFERIPVNQNVELYTKQSAVVKRLAARADESLYARFIAAMKADPQRAHIYKQAEPATEREWEYPLRMMSPDQDGTATLLEFQVSTYRIVGGAGFLVTCVPTGATVSVIEAQYNRLMKAYGEHNYVYTLPDDREQEISLLPESFTNLIRAYYPTIIQDSLWYIVQENKAHQLLVGDSVAGIHFFELFFAPQLKEWMEPIQETSAPRAIKYFEAYTARFIRENAELHDDYEQMMRRLLQSPDFSNLLAISHRMSIRIIQPESDQAIFYTCRVILPWPYTRKITLSFRSMVQYIEHGLLGHTDGRNYRVILVPENYETEIALIALHLFSAATTLVTATEQTTDMVLKQFLWILAFVLTVQEDLALQEGECTPWEPEEAFANIHEDLEARFSPAPENALATVKAELQAIMAELDRADKVGKDTLLTLLHSITGTKPYLEQVTVFLLHELAALATSSHSVSV